MDGLPDCTSELARLLQFAAEIAWVARTYCGNFAGGSGAEDFNNAGAPMARSGSDLMRLMSVVYGLKEVANAMECSEANAIQRACAAALAAFDTFQFGVPGPDCSGVSTYEIWRDVLPLDHAREALQSVQARCMTGAAGAEG